MIATATMQAASASRLFRGSPEVVFRAWTDRDELPAWWCPPGFSMVEIEQDLRPGGRYRYAMRRDADGGRYDVFGEFVEIRRPDLLVYTWSWNAPNMEAAETQVTVRFEPEGDGTRLTLTHERFPSASMQQSHLLGWTGCFDRMAARLGGGAHGEMAGLAEELREARRVTLKELAGLNEAQWSFRPSADRWSIAEITEHLADAAGYGLMTVTGMIAGPEHGTDLSANDAPLRSMIADRSQKFKAEVPPSGKETMPEARGRFLGLIESLATFVEGNAKDLRRFTASSPTGTDWDGQQWVFATACHTLRHVDQIREVKLATGYPA